MHASAQLDRPLLDLRSSVGRDVPVIRLPEYDAVRSALGDCRGLRVLDAGCGDGQLTRITAQASCTIAIDSNVRLLSGPNAHIHFAGADATNMPFACNSFDAALCTSVLSSLPSPEQRTALLAELARVLRPNGRLIITVSHFNFRFRRNGVPKEGYADGLYYRKYDLDEFHADLQQHFNVTALWGLWNYLPKTYRLYIALGRHAIYWERWFRTKQASLKYGKILLAICRKKQTA